MRGRAPLVGAARRFGRFQVFGLYARAAQPAADWSSGAAGEWGTGCCYPAGEGVQFSSATKDRGLPTMQLRLGAFTHLRATGTQ